MYKRQGIDIAELSERFMNNDALMTRFLSRFPQDKNHDMLKRALADGDVQAAYNAAHTLKGVTGNLSTVSYTHLDVYKRQTDNGAQLHVRSAGCENVPVKLEFILEPDGHYCSNDVEMVLRKGAYLYQKCTDAVYQYDDHRELHIVGGCFAHAYGCLLYTSRCV